MAMGHLSKQIVRVFGISGPFMSSKKSKRHDTAGTDPFAIGLREFIGLILVPEAAMRLIMGDMGLNMRDKGKAVSVLQGSAGIRRQRQPTRLCGRVGWRVGHLGKHRTQCLVYDNRAQFTATDASNG